MKAVGIAEIHQLYTYDSNHGLGRIVELPLLTGCEQSVSSDEFQQGDQGKCAPAGKNEHSDENIGSRDTSGVEVIHDHEQGGTGERKHSSSVWTNTLEHTDIAVTSIASSELLTLVWGYQVPPGWALGLEEE